MTWRGHGYPATREPLATGAQLPRPLNRVLAAARGRHDIGTPNEIPPVMTAKIYTAAELVELLDTIVLANLMTR